MSNLKTEISEPEPAATSLPNDKTVKEEASEPSATAEKDVAMEGAELEDVKAAAEVKEEQKVEENGSASDVKQEKSDSKTERKKPTEVKKERFDDNGVLKTNARIYESDERKNYSKYDPAVLPPTDDPSKIRAQVCSNAVSLQTSATDNFCKGRILLQ